MDTEHTGSKLPVKEMVADQDVDVFFRGVYLQGRRDRRERTMAQPGRMVRCSSSRELQTLP
jgi:hypothetical protein